MKAKPKPKSKPKRKPVVEERVFEGGGVTVKVNGRVVAKHARVKASAPISSGPIPFAHRPDLRVLLAEWQPRMRLADWEIVARYVPNLDANARSRSTPRMKRATIDILEPAHWEPGRWAPDVERALLHELGHVLLSVLMIPVDHPNDLHEEQIVESYARALYDAKYAPPKPVPA